MEKTKYELKYEAVSALVAPATLQTEAQNTPIAGGTTTTFAVYGTNEVEQRVWCATFFDVEEAQAWVQASKVFGRHVRGAVIANKGETNGAEESSQES